MGKKIGILTFHRAVNWGAMLQCYALHRSIESLGHDVDIIDYRQAHIEKAYEYSRKITDKKELLKIIIRPRWWFGFFSRILPNRFKMRNAKLGLVARLPHSRKFESADKFPQEYDHVVIGSDQVWANYCTDGIDEIYYGEFPHSKTKITGYAISSNIESIEENGLARVKELCKNFSSISFREEGISQYLKEKIGLKSDTVIDPTLLLERKDWDNIVKDTHIHGEEDYVLTHFLNEEFEKKILNEKLNSFARMKRCRIVELEDVVASPEEFIAWIKKAKYIITSSFHVTVFSVIYNKDFLSLRTNNGKDIRYINLLKKFGIENRLAEYDSVDCATIYDIDYSKVKEILTEERKASMRFLKNSLS